MTYTGGGIITLSHGRLSSYVATHFFNIQVRATALSTAELAQQMRSSCIPLKWPVMPQEAMHRLGRCVQDELLGYLADEQLGGAAAEVLAGKVFTHTLQPRPRLVLVDRAGCCGGAHAWPKEGLQCITEQNCANDDTLLS